MFDLPSIGNLIVSTLAFICVAWFVRRNLSPKLLLSEKGHSILVFVTATIVSWGAGVAVDKWVSVTPIEQVIPFMKSLALPLY